MVAAQGSHVPVTGGHTQPGLTFTAGAIPNVQEVHPMKGASISAPDPAHSGSPKRPSIHSDPAGAAAPTVAPGGTINAVLAAPAQPGGVNARSSIITVQGVLLVRLRKG